MDSWENKQNLQLEELLAPGMTASRKVMSDCIEVMKVNTRATQVSISDYSDCRMVTWKK